MLDAVDGLAGRLDALDGRGLTTFDLFMEGDLALGARLDVLEQQKDGLHAWARKEYAAAAQERAAIANRVKANTAKITYLATHLAIRLDELEIVVAGNDRTFREIISDNAKLADRLNTQTQCMEQYARIEEERLVAYQELAARLDALPLRVSLLRDNYAALETELNGLRDIISATLNRLAEIEKPSRVVLTPDGEWVQGNGLLPSDVLDGSRGGGE